METIIRAIISLLYRNVMIHFLREKFFPRIDENLFNFTPKKITIVICHDLLIIKSNNM